MRGVIPHLLKIWAWCGWTWNYAGWHKPVFGLVSGFVLLAVLALARRRMGFRFASRKNEEKGPSDINTRQCVAVGALTLFLFAFAFYLDLSSIISCVALVVTIFVLLDSNVLWATRRAASHATNAKQAVEEASQKVDALRAEVLELDGKVRKLTAVEALPNMKEIIDKLGNALGEPETVVGAMLLAATPAVGLSGGENHHTFRSLRDKLLTIGERVHREMRIICYDEAGRLDFYTNERMIRAEKVLNEFKKLTTNLIQEFNSVSIVLKQAPRTHANQTKRPGKTKNDSRYLLDGIHFLIVRRQPGPRASEAVIWHLDVPLKPDTPIQGAGFWTSHEDIIHTFEEVFEATGGLIRV